MRIQLYRNRVDDRVCTQNSQLFDHGRAVPRQERKADPPP